MDDDWADVLDAHTPPLKPAPTGMTPDVNLCPTATATNDLLLPPPTVKPNPSSPALFLPVGVPAAPARGGSKTSDEPTGSTTPGSEDTPPGPAPGVPVEVPAPDDAPGPMPDPGTLSPSRNPPPPSPSQVPTLPGATPAPEFDARPPLHPTSANEGPNRLLVVGGLAALVVAGIWALLAGGEPGPPPASETTLVAAGATTPAPDPAAVAPVDANLTDTPKLRPHAPDDPTPEPESESKPEPEPAPAGPPTDGSPKTVEDLVQAFELATSAYKLESTPESQRALILAACDLVRGGPARRAYRTLASEEARTQVRTHCSERGVDLTLRTRDDTAPELLAQGRAAFAAGDTARANVLARKSQRLNRSPDAVLLMGRSSCKLGDAKMARYAASQLRLKVRKTLAAECQANGIDLPTGA